MNITREEIGALISKFQPLQNPFVTLAKRHGFDIEHGDDLLVIPAALIREHPEWEAHTRGIKGIKISPYAKIMFLLNHKLLMGGMEQMETVFHP